MKFCSAETRERIHVAGFGAVPDRGRDRGAEERLEPESQHAVPHPDRRGPGEIFPLSNGQRPVQKGEEAGRRHGDRHRGLAGPSRIFTAEGLHRGPRGFPNTEVSEIRDQSYDDN